MPREVRLKIHIFPGFRDRGNEEKLVLIRYNQGVKPGAKAIMVNENKILVILRDNLPNIQYPNMWDLPGGGLEEGETMEEGLLREIKEELNLTPQSLIMMGNQISNEGKIMGRGWIKLAKNEVGQIKLGDEGQKYEFMVLEDILNLDFIPRLKDFLKKNYKYFNKIIKSGEDPDENKINFSTW